MAFNVTLYTFAKRTNSTSQPSAAGTTVACTAKLPLDVITPTIQLQLTGGAAANPSAYNYARITDFGRYYWIRTWRNVGPLWEADLQVDPLASWKTQIGAQSCYIYRSAYSFDSHVPDTLYPTKSNIRALNIPLSRPWTVGAASASGAAANSGYYVAAIISTGGTKWYAFTELSWSLFLFLLYSDDYYQDVLTVFGADAYPEAKVAVNPMQYISSVKWCPIGLSSNGQWSLHYSQTVTTIPVGVASVSHPTGFSTYPVYELAEVPTVSTFDQIDTSAADFAHPQADDRGDWLNYAPYTSVELFYPPFGLIQLDPVVIAKYRYLRVELTTDHKTCTCHLEVYCYEGENRRVIYRGAGSFGVDVPVSAIMKTGTSPLSMAGAALSVVGGAVSMGMGNIIGGAAGIIGGVKSAIGQAVSGQLPHLSSMGGPGSTAQMIGTPYLYVTHWYLAEDDPDDLGRPLCDIRTISAIPGYIMCDSDHVSISCTSRELTEITTAMAAGFYYE